MTNKLLERLLSAVISALVPVLLVLLSVRLVLTPAYVNLLYQMPFFPEDAYGWDESIRLEYGAYGVKYLLNDENIDYLGNLEIEGERAFTPRELDHMEDVKVVTRGALTVLNISLVIFVLVASLLAYRSRPVLLRAIQRGGIKTLAIILILLLTMLISWDFFFDSFHAMFFADGTWKFYLNDTLIRLYPQPFWFSSSLVVGFITIGGALGCIFAPRWYLKQGI